jgi:hypothetical protein
LDRKVSLMAESGKDQGFSIRGDTRSNGVHFAPGVKVYIEGKTVQGDQVKEEKAVVVHPEEEPYVPGEPSREERRDVKKIKGDISGGRGPVIINGPVEIEGDVSGR